MEAKNANRLLLPLLVTVAVVVLCLFVFWPILKTVLFAATLAVVLTPYYRWLERRLWGVEPPRWKQALTAGIMSVMSIVILAVLFLVAVIIVVRNFDLLSGFAQKVASVAEKWCRESLGVNFDLKDAVATRAADLFGYVQGFFFAATGFLVRVVIFVASLYFFLRHGGELIESIRGSLSGEQREVFERFVKPAHAVLYAIYVVHVGTAIITFILAIPFFALIGFSDIVFWSLLCAVFQLVPVLGPSLIMFSIAAYAFATGDSTAGTLCLAVGYPVVAVVPDVVFRPIMMGRKVKLSALLLLLGFIGGLMSAGAIGFIIGPLLLVMLSEALVLASERLREHNEANQAGQSGADS